jgi:hypothetical protein
MGIMGKAYRQEAGRLRGRRGEARRGRRGEEYDDKERRLSTGKSGMGIGLYGERVRRGWEGRKDYGD